METKKSLWVAINEKHYCASVGFGITIELRQLLLGSWNWEIIADGVSISNPNLYGNCASLLGAKVNSFEAFKNLFETYVEEVRKGVGA